MVIYRGIEHEIIGDAPFVGARLLAPYCYENCSGCFNQDLKLKPLLKHSPSTILDEVQSNKFNQGIILGGLEWTETPVGMFHLIREARARKIPVILYTSMEESHFYNIFYDALYKEIFVKFGKFRSDSISFSHFSHGIKLASTNQYIRRPYEK